jgi:hypothetical protein
MAWNKELIFFFSKFASEYVFRRVEENQIELKLNGTHKLWFYADDVNIFGENI